MASQDRKQISWKQKHEVNYILNHFFHKETKQKLTLLVLKDIAWNLGKGGKLCTSRRLCYVGIRALGFIFKP